MRAYLTAQGESLKASRGGQLHTIGLFAIACCLALIAAGIFVIARHLGRSVHVAEDTQKSIAHFASVVERLAKSQLNQDNKMLRQHADILTRQERGLVALGDQVDWLTARIRHLDAERVAAITPGSSLPAGAAPLGEVVDVVEMYELNEQPPWEWADERWDPSNPLHIAWVMWDRMRKDPAHLPELWFEDVHEPSTTPGKANTWFEYIRTLIRFGPDPIPGVVEVFDDVMASAVMHVLEGWRADFELRARRQAPEI